MILDDVEDKVGHVVSGGDVLRTRIEDVV